MEKFKIERSLFEIYKDSRRQNKLNFNLIFLIISLVFLFFLIKVEKENIENSLSLILEWSDYGLTFAISILGFLIAGFTIFATLGDRELYILLSENHKEEGLSYLKYAFFSFMEVFIVYIFCSFIFIFQKLFFCKACFLVNYFFSQSSSHLVSTSILFKTFLILNGGLILSMLLYLKSFVYNIYHVVLISIEISKSLHGENFDEILKNLE